MQRVHSLLQASSYRKIKMLPEKHKKYMTILFVDWHREKPKNNKRFEDVHRKQERRKEKLTVGEMIRKKKIRKNKGRWNVTPEEKKIYI